MEIGAIADPVVSALKQAAAVTGSDFHYLLGTAMRESSLKPAAQSSTSSAAGLFQFVEQTWLGLVKTHGAQYGLSAMADAISVDSRGHYRAASESGRKAILALRTDPQISALMAGEYTKASALSMQTLLGRPACGGELYAAHFLGPDAACKLIRVSESAPGASAAALLPNAAGANKNVFFHADGSAKSVREVYDWVMQQPGAATPARAPVPGPGPGSVPVATAQRQDDAVMRAAGASSANIESLLASVMNWQPSHNFFSPRRDGAPSSPLALSPGLLNIFSES
jgi:hypothetical protein